jgi:hypothetical protein
MARSDDATLASFQSRHPEVSAETSGLQQSAWSNLHGAICMQKTDGQEPQVHSSDKLTAPASVHERHLSAPSWHKKISC